MRHRFLSPQSQYNAWASGESQARPWECSGPGLNSSTWESFKTHYDLRKGLATYLYSAFEAQSRTGLSLSPARARAARSLSLTHTHSLTHPNTCIAGMPVTRALVMDSPDDTDTWHVDDQFMIGSDLMFAPGGMEQSTATSRSVYMFRAILLLSANQFGIVFLCHFGKCRVHHFLGQLFP